MLGYRLATIERHDDLARFKERYESSVHDRSKGTIRTSVCLDYLRRARVTGLMDPVGELVGGYVINHSAPLLVLQTVPEPARARWAQEPMNNTLCELVAIWKAPSIPQRVAALVLWPGIIRDCAFAGRSFILGLGYDNRMNEVYRIARPITVYEGPRSDKPELSQRVHIYAFTPRSIALTYCVNLATELLLKPARRALGRQRRRG